jgi:hypothetical protein
MLEKLATHDVQDVSVLFSLADKWESKPNAGTQAQGSGNGNNNNKKKKKASGNQPLAGAPTIVATVVGGGRGGQEMTNAPISYPITMTAA